MARARLFDSGGPRRVLVTGGAGFLGSHLCRRLLDDGFHVTALDDLSTGFRANLAGLHGRDGFRFVRHDVRAPLPDEPFDQIYNLACPASPPQYQRDPTGTLLTCVLGTLHVLQLAERRGARVLHASTSEVYGDPRVHPQPESYLGAVNCTGPRACYDEGKRAAETLCFDHRRSRGVSVRVVRIFNTYGPHMSPEDGRVVSNFVTQALAGVPLTIYGEGQQTRSFCYVDDTVEAFVRFMALDDEDVGPVNIGNPEEFTVAELAHMVLRETGSESRLEKRPLPQDDPKVRRPDIARALALLGWAPQVPLLDGLRRTIEWYRAVGAQAPMESQAAR